MLRLPGRAAICPWGGDGYGPVSPYGPNFGPWGAFSLGPGYGGPGGYGCKLQRRVAPNLQSKVALCSAHAEPMTRLWRAASSTAGDQNSSM